MIFSSLGPFTTTVAVTHSTKNDEINKILGISPDAVQVSSDIPVNGNSKVIRVARPGHPLPIDCDAVLIDASLGRGILFDKDFALEIKGRSNVPVLLAGGLRPDNVRDAIRKIHPYAVDVATGVEDSPGIKNENLVREFIKNSRETENE